jgi:transcriptional regulator with XRE-family HTH domain
MTGEEVIEMDGDTQPSAAGPTVEALGREIRELRRLKGMTLENLAAAANVSSGSLSQIERGNGNPSFNLLVQVAHALDVSVTRFFAHEDTQASPVVKSEDRRVLEAHGVANGLSQSSLLTPTRTTALEAVYTEAQPGYSTEDSPFVHQGEEFGFVISGRHEVVVDGVSYLLETGDSITYPSSVPHWYRNPGTETSKAIWVITPPSF